MTFSRGLLPALFSFFALFSGPAEAIIAGQVVPGQDALARQAVLVVNSAAHGCTGTLVGRRSVVTAAHCLPPNEKAVVAFLRDQKPVAFSTVIHSARHPGLVRPDTGRTAPVDVAVLVLADLPPPGFAPARIAASDANKGQTVTIAGYGRMRMNDMSADGRLRRVSLPVIERSVSGYLLIGHPDGAERQANPSACQGDSGGPVFLNGALAGVLSLVAGENDRMGCGYLTVAMPVPSIAGWIRGEIARGEMIQNGALKTASMPTGGERRALPTEVKTPAMSWTDGPGRN